MAKIETQERVLTSKQARKAIEENTSELSDQLWAIAGQRYLVELVGHHGVDRGQQHRHIETWWIVEITETPDYMGTGEAWGQHSDEHSKVFWIAYRDLSDARREWVSQCESLSYDEERGT